MDVIKVFLAVILIFADCTYSKEIIDAFLDWEKRL